MPSTVRFTACWHFATAKYGIYALPLQRAMQLGFCESAWAMLHRFLSFLAQPGLRPLAGIVGVDETFIGGHEPGMAGGRACGKKVLACVATEISDPRSLRMAGAGTAASGHAGKFLSIIASAAVYPRRRPRGLLPGDPPGRSADQSMAAAGHPPRCGSPAASGQLPG